MRIRSDVTHYEQNERKYRLTGTAVSLITNTAPLWSSNVNQSRVFAEQQGPCAGKSHKKGQNTQVTGGQ